MEKSKENQDEIAEALPLLEGWQREDSRIAKSWKVKPYLKAVAFVNQIAWLAEMQNHHPNIELSWGMVKVSITSHDKGALTMRDIRLAQAIDQLNKDF